MECQTELPLDELHLALERCVSKLSGKTRNCGRHAFIHLRKAWLIRNVDPTMAVFRAITAEEEAASAVILSLQQKGYPNADCLNHRLHVHKAALTPFLKAVAKVLEVAEFVGPTLRLDENNNPPTLHVRFDMRNAGMKGSEPLFASPDQPLNFLIRRGAAEGEVHSFEEELREIARERGVNEITKFIEAEANARNRVLYATDNGVPTVSVPEGFFFERLRRVTVLLLLTLAINQTVLHQLFVTQCLQALLLVLPRIKSSAFEFDEVQSTEGPSVTIIKEPGAEPIAMITEKWAVTVPISFTWGYRMTLTDPESISSTA